MGRLHWSRRAMRVHSGISQVIRQQECVPALVRPTLARPTLVRPSLAQPTLTRPTLTRPTLAQPTLARPTLVRRALVRPALAGSQPAHLLHRGLRYLPDRGLPHP
ncbi:hypothetical protein [Micromonospora sp. NPDC023633]|uniref:hypothetical protein n=1 Tax=Micromonospora sp. NPDC023633 TaxID=3154320 RepID=UPI0033E4B9A7